MSTKRRCGGQIVKAMLSTTTVHVVKNAWQKSTSHSLWRCHLESFLLYQIMKGLHRGDSSRKMPFSKKIWADFVRWSWSCRRWSCRSYQQKYRMEITGPVGRATAWPAHLPDSAAWWEYAVKWLKWRSRNFQSVSTYFTDPLNIPLNKALFILVTEYKSVKLTVLVIGCKKINCLRHSLYACTTLKCKVDKIGRYFHFVSFIGSNRSWLLTGIVLDCPHELVKIALDCSYETKKS